MRVWSRSARAAGHRIGFVPTMGALHRGHVALIEAARRRCDCVIVSVFVNPTQFGPGEDFEAYPRNLRRDREIAGEAGADAVFAPPRRTMYPRPPETTVSVPGLQGILCGATRRGHFDGVCLIVSKLLNSVEPDDLFLGQKDAQQAVILTRMIEDLDFGVRVRICPTVRERDGLALSSRNAYLDPEERRRAVRIHAALQAGRRAIREGEARPGTVRAILRRKLGRAGELEYA